MDVSTTIDTPFCALRERHVNLRAFIPFPVKEGRMAKHRCHSRHSLHHAHDPSEEDSRGPALKAQESLTVGLRPRASHRFQAVRSMRPERLCGDAPRDARVIASCQLGNLPVAAKPPAACPTVEKKSIVTLEFDHRAYSILGVDVHKPWVHTCIVGTNHGRPSRAARNRTFAV